MIPEPFELLLLTLGGFRLVRLIGWDTITEPVRVWLTCYRDDGAPSLHEDLDYEENGNPIGHSRARVYVSTLIRCPWCVSVHTSVALYILWLWQPTYTLAAMVPAAMSAAAGLIAKNLDA